MQDEPCSDFLGQCWREMERDQGRPGELSDHESGASGVKERERREAPVGKEEPGVCSDSASRGSGIRSQRCPAEDTCLSPGAPPAAGLLVRSSPRTARLTEAGVGVQLACRHKALKWGYELSLGVAVRTRDRICDELIPAPGTRELPLSLLSVMMSLSFFIPGFRAVG